MKLLVGARVAGGAGRAVGAERGRSDGALRLQVAVGAEREVEIVPAGAGPERQPAGPVREQHLIIGGVERVLAGRDVAAGHADAVAEGLCLRPAVLRRRERQRRAVEQERAAALGDHVQADIRIGATERQQAGRGAAAAENWMPLPPAGP